MKAGIAAALWAIRAVKQAGVKLAGDVSFLSTVGEESGSAGAIAFAAGCRKYDAAIIGEPTSLVIAPANSGSLHAKVFLCGHGTHAGVREAGVSAIGKFGRLLDALEGFEQQRNDRLTHPLYTEVRNKVPVNVGVVHGGTWAAMVPEQVECHVRIGVMPDESLRQVQTEFDGFIRGWAADDPWLREHPPVVDWSGPQVPGTAIPVDSPLVYAVEISPDLISRVTDAVVDEVTGQLRPLKPMYPVVLFDPLRVKIHEDAVVRHQAVYLALGVLPDETRDILGLWIENTEGAKFWMKVFNDLKHRGVEDILIAVNDGLKGMPEALEVTLPATTLQTCIVHLIGNSLEYAKWRDRKGLAAAVKPI